MKSVSVPEGSRFHCIGHQFTFILERENKPVCTSNPHQFFKVETHTLHVEKKWNKTRTYRDKPPLILLHLHVLNI